MSNGAQWIEPEDSGPRIHRKKPDKRFFCRKNKDRSRYGQQLYGQHSYAEDTGECIYCKRKQNKESIRFEKENDDEQE